MKQIVVVVILIIVCLLLFKFCKPTTDNEYISNQSKELSVPEILAQVKQKLDQFVNHLKITLPNDERVKRMASRYQNLVLDESREKETYTINKGEKMVLCLRNYKKNGELHDDMNLIMFVCLHELAHIMTITAHHTEEFWNNFHFILKEANKFNIYKPIDYQHDPTWYCAMLVYDNPYFRERSVQEHIHSLREILYN